MHDLHMPLTVSMTLILFTTIITHRLVYPTFYLVYTCVAVALVGEWIPI